MNGAAAHQPRPPNHIWLCDFGHERGGKKEVNNHREDEREISCGGEYGNGVKEFLGCARAQCDSERAQMGGKKRNTRVEGVEEARGASEEAKER